eukprot:COSAG05_NODE_10092_length_583_cov_1.161157_1_plen_20_part_10
MKSSIYGLRNGSIFETNPER